MLNFKSRAHLHHFGAFFIRHVSFWGGFLKTGLSSVGSELNLFLFLISQMKKMEDLYVK